jgi:hypothetical protein
LGSHHIIAIAATSRRVIHEDGRFFQQELGVVTNREYGVRIESESHRSEWEIGNMMQNKKSHVG